ncbi:MAG: preprotein translocase subunit SecE [Atopobiaceae bacterium]|jgi:preprotein translocase subunit SecE|nr:preprotein translocase subunit SecE [Atopobiaceae bacterium]MCI2173910.1 preprotein translocase subunit SecE [Atopobiaceae bacterium]MCI2208000.1 preprotein translocase subunit SecE [Atopobiaceae bacterium]
MANKERNKRSARKARAAEREERAAAAEAVATDSTSAKKSEKADITAKAPAKKSAEKQAKVGVFSRMRNYLSDVRTEMHRVVWPSREELKSYSLAVIAMLVVFGVAIWLIDTGVTATLVGYSGLRG